MIFIGVEPFLLHWLQALPNCNFSFSLEIFGGPPFRGLLKLECIALMHKQKEKLDILSQKLVERWINVVIISMN